MHTIVDNTTHSNAQLKHYFKGFKSLPPELVVNEIAECRDLATQGANINISATDSQARAYHKRLVDAGLIDAVLPFLGRGENETFHNVLDETNKGDLASPSIWLNLLQNATRQNCLPQAQLDAIRMQIALAMGPFVSCFMKHRKFFSLLAQVD